MIRKTNETEAFRKFESHADIRKKNASPSKPVKEIFSDAREEKKPVVNLHELRCERCAIIYSWLNEFGATKRFCAPCVPLAAKEYRTAKKKNYRKLKRAKKGKYAVASGGIEPPLESLPMPFPDRETGGDAQPLV